MICPCGIDHWLHVALGFQGIVGMMVMLEAQETTASPIALEMLEKYRDQLAAHIARQKSKVAPKTGNP